MPPKSKNGPRSTFSLLPFEVRYRIVGMIQDGCTAQTIASDIVVSDAFAKVGSVFTRSGMTRIKKCAEYRDLSAKRAARKSAELNDQIASALIRENGSIDTIADRTKVALLKALSELSDLSDLSDESRIKALRSVTQSVALLSGQEKDNRIAALMRKLDEKNEKIKTIEAEWNAREAELLARIAGLEKMIPGIDTGKVSEAMDKKFLN